MKKIVIGAVLCAIIAAPNVSQAATYQTTSYSNASYQAQLAYLYAMVLDLQRQLLALQQSNNVGGGTGPGTGTSMVTTHTATEIDGDEAELHGQVELRSGDDEITVWFEYGEDRDLDESTRKSTADNLRGRIYAFYTTIDDLDDDQRYYYRAASEDEDGRKHYGEIRSFTSDDDGRSSSRDDDDDYVLDISDDSIEEGDSVRVSWELADDDDASSRNWIGLFETGADDDDYEDWTYIDNDTEGSETFYIDDEGKYEFRLFLSGDDRSVAESDEIEVEN